jgi:UDP-glucose 4-epimerase
MRILITGASGFIGQQLLNDLAIQHPKWSLIACDIRPLAEQWLKPNVEAVLLDISQPAAVRKAVATYQPNVIVHLASVVGLSAGLTAEQVRAIDIGGTESIIHAAQANAVEQLIVISSGAAYGYFAQNAEWIDEQDPLRSDRRFTYVEHKCEVEQLLAKAREQYPQLRQLVLRPGTILGKRASNHISALFKKRALLGVAGSRSRFVFIWDQDVVGIIRQGIEKRSSGIYNLAGDGALSLAEIAKILGKPYRCLPAGFFAGALRLLKPLGLCQYGPEQLDLLRYRPVLANRRLKEEFGYQPRYTSREAFMAYLAAEGVKAYA